MSSKQPADDENEIGTLRQALAERTRELEEAREALERYEQRAILGQLVSVVVHELRSPLGAMLTSLHLVESRIGKMDSTAKKGLERIRRSIRRCDDVISNILDYSRLEPMALEETLIDQWLQALFRTRSLPEGVLLSFEPGFDENSAPVDREKLYRAVVHLVDNAAEAALHAGKPGRVAVCTRRNGDCLEIRVSDNGPGIPEDYQSRIFEPFYSGRKAGIGLGLPIALSVVEKHGGTITFESIPDTETAFTISLPL